jgi:hypothetical protein
MPVTVTDLDGFKELLLFSPLALPLRPLPPLPPLPTEIWSSLMVCDELMT